MAVAEQAPALDPIADMLDDPAMARTTIVARTTQRRSLAHDAPWCWYQEWRVCLITPAGQDMLMVHFPFHADRVALCGEQPALLQDRRVDVAPDGSEHPHSWTTYAPARTPWDALWNGGTGVARAELSMHALHALVVARLAQHRICTEELAHLERERAQIQPPDLRTWHGQYQARVAQEERITRALKAARLLAAWTRAQGDPEALAALEPRLAPVRERVRAEQQAEEQARAEALARVNTRIAALQAQREELASGPEAPALCG